MRTKGIKPKVAGALIELFNATDMSPEDLDERAIEMVRGQPQDHVLYVLKEVSSLYKAQSQCETSGGYHLTDISMIIVSATSVAFFFLQFAEVISIECYSGELARA